MYRVVVADDEVEFRNWLRAVLEASCDYQVVGEAGTGKETVGLVESLLPDVLIADVYMPEPDGLEVARYLRLHFPAIKAILISAHEERTYARLAREEGALAFIPKAKLSVETLSRTLQGQKRS